MIEVTEMFYGNGFALDHIDDARSFIARVGELPGWKSAVIKDKWCFRTYFTFKVEYESKEEYEKNFTLMNAAFVAGLNKLGYEADDFNESNVRVSVIGYEKPVTFREWRESRGAR